MKSSLYRRNDSFAKTLAKVCLILLLSDTSIQAQGKPEPIDYSAELPRVPALEPEEAAKRIEVADGYEIQLVAAEPMINSPVAIEWDAKGGMFVCEMRGYSENRDDAISRVRYLTDTNRDGTYDRVTTFAEGLLWPTAIFPYKNGLFVADAPHLYYYRDNNQDGVADDRKIVLTGFAMSNVQGLVNSFRWGLDNRIHVACSSVGGSVHRPGEEDAALNVRGRDLSFNPDTYEFTVTSGGAQHGMCFDDWGHKFASSNSDHIQQVIYQDRYLKRNRFLTAPSSRLSIAADGPQAPVFRISPVEPWRIVRTRLRVGGVVSGPVEGGGRPSGYFTGATGVTIYRGDNWPAEDRGVAIVGDVGSNLIHRKRITQETIQMKAERMDPSTEFARSSDIWFRPAQFANAPDGSLHVVDVCREVIEHPRSLPPEIKKHLDLNSGRDRGRIFRIIQKGSSTRTNPDLSIVKSEQLVALLEHPNAWHRETSARLLYERQATTVIPELVSLAKTASIPQGKIHSLRSLSGLRALTTDVLKDALDDPHPQVRRHAIQLSEELADQTALHQKLARLAQDPNAEVRYQLAFSMGEFNHPKKAEILTELVRKGAESKWITLAAMSSLRDEAGEVFAELITNNDFQSSAAADMLSSLAQMIVRENDAQQVSTALEGLSKMKNAEPSFALPLLGKFREIRQETVKTDAFQKQFDSLITITIKQAVDSELELDRRLIAVNSLAFGDWSQVQNPLVALATQDPSSLLSTAALRVASQFNQSSVTDLLLEGWNQQTPDRRKMVIEAVFARQERIKVLFDRISDGIIPVSEIPRSRYTVAANSRNAEIKNAALAFLRKTATVSRDAILKNYRTAMEESGNPNDGRVVFRKHCVGCHKVEGQGYELGPNLSAMKARGADAILANILDPNLEVNPQYINYILLKVDGTSATGMIASENATTVTLKRAEGASETILREDIEQMQSSRKSIMPEELEKSISPREMADLVAYLMTAQ